MILQELDRDYKIYVILTLSDHEMKQKTYFSIFFVYFFKGEGYNFAKFSTITEKFRCEDWSK